MVEKLLNSEQCSQLLKNNSLSKIPPQKKPQDFSTCNATEKIHFFTGVFRVLFLYFRKTYFKEHLYEMIRSKNGYI